MDSRPPMLKAAAIGGSALGAAAALPFVGMLQCACCSLVMGGGFLSAFIYYRDCVKSNAPFNAGTGALVGFIAAPFYALSTTLVSGVFQMLMRVSLEDAFREGFDKMEEMGQELPPEAEQVIEFISNAGPLMMLVIGFCFWLLIAAIFSTIGGVIGGAAFGRDAVPPPAPSSPADDTTKTM